MNKIFLMIIFFSIAVNAQSSDDELVNPKDLIPDIVIDLRYSTADHVFRNLPSGDIALPKFYTCNESLMLNKLVKALKLAQDSLRNIRTYNSKNYPSGIGIKIWDGYRPRAVQYLLFDVYPNPVYIADPTSGSMHNRGGAVDLTLVDLATGDELEMPTLFDDFSSNSSHTNMNLSQEVINNRQLLKDVLTKVAGLKYYESEWWHYNLSDASSYPLMDFQMK
ncbi:MAG: peptidase M15 [Ignavibacteriales bacterium CG_4_9_14_3_um_filter_34_10]|nr:MAG: peptidase M15 [Ignavibacteriales bacterium CG_4_9_14_3_um_filter_34_10]